MLFHDSTVKNGGVLLLMGTHSAIRHLELFFFTLSNTKEFHEYMKMFENQGAVGKGK